MAGFRTRVDVWKAFVVGRCIPTPASMYDLAFVPVAHCVEQTVNAAHVAATLHYMCVRRVYFDLRVSSLDLHCVPLPYECWHGRWDVE